MADWAAFSTLRFRRAMSVAINREEINEVIFFGLGRPAQLTAHTTSRAYKEEYANAYAQYDVTMANKLLDERADPQVYALGMKELWQLRRAIARS